MQSTCIAHLTSSENFSTFAACALDISNTRRYALELTTVSLCTPVCSLREEGRREDREARRERWREEQQGGSTERELEDEREEA